MCHCNQSNLFGENAPAFDSMLIKKCLKECFGFYPSDNLIEIIYYMKVTISTVRRPALLRYLGAAHSRVVFSTMLVPASVETREDFVQFVRATYTKEHRCVFLELIDNRTPGESNVRCRHHVSNLNQYTIENTEVGLDQIKELMQFQDVLDRAKTIGQLPYDIRRNNCHLFTQEIYNACLQVGSDRNLLRPPNWLLISLAQPASPGSSPDSRPIRNSISHPISNQVSNGSRDALEAANDVVGLVVYLFRFFKTLKRILGRNWHHLVFAIIALQLVIHFRKLFLNVTESTKSPDAI